MAVPPTYNNAPWKDAVIFLDEDGQPEAVVEPVLLGLRSQRKFKGYALVVLPEEMIVEDNIVFFEVPRERMEDLLAGDYNLEVGMGEGTDRYIFGWVQQTIIEGINP